MKHVFWWAFVTLFFLVATLFLVAYRTVTFNPDDLATKSDVRQVKAVIASQSTKEERERKELAITEKQKHEELIKKLKIAEQQQKKNMAEIAAIRRKLNAEER